MRRRIGGFPIGVERINWTFFQGSSGYSSYAGEVYKAPENLVNRNFHADEPNLLWLTDITEFRLPGGEKVYLSPVIDCFGGMLSPGRSGCTPTSASRTRACA